MNRNALREMRTFYSQMEKVYEAIAEDNRGVAEEYIHGAAQTFCALSNSGLDVAVLKENISMAKQALDDMEVEDDSE